MMSFERCPFYALSDGLSLYPFYALSEGPLSDPSEKNQIREKSQIREKNQIREPRL